ncbi:MAG TPA: serine hydrolase domain-containing protein, partial [Gemmatimonadaceae bacterium]|nr:serine hydrolase domain-containing protein [Gemmatimonadaceae bacterium]
DQQILWSGGYGYADIARKAPATASTIYSICSISKLFTSVATMQLRDAGRLRLDDPVAKHLPWFTIKQSYPEREQITIEGLLTHASGLPRESEWPYWTGPDFPFPTHEQIVAKINQQETLYPAEQYFQYSNLGLSLAGEIVAAKSDMPYADYVTQNILKPLGLTSTTPEMPASERGKRLATGYGKFGRNEARTPLAFFQARGIAPAAGYASTAEDLARFAMWQFRNLAANGTEVLAANTLREMHRPHFVDPNGTTMYGLGFSAWRSGDKGFVGHGGSCPGYQTQLLLKPDERIAAVSMTNAVDANANLLAQRMYDIVAPAILAARKDTASRPKAPDATLAAYAGTYDGTFGGETAVMTWDGSLATFRMPSDDPMRTLTKWRKTGEHTFRRVRPDGELGETMRFELGADGKASAYWLFSNRYVRSTTVPTTQ